MSKSIREGLAKKNEIYGSAIYNRGPGKKSIEFYVDGIEISDNPIGG